MTPALPDKLPGEGILRLASFPSPTDRSSSHQGEVLKKKIEKKMVLNRETLRRLAGGELGKVIGGMRPYEDTNEPSCLETCSCECK